MKNSLKTAFFSSVLLASITGLGVTANAMTRSNDGEYFSGVNRSDVSTSAGAGHSARSVASFIDRSTTGSISKADASGSNIRTTDRDYFEGINR